MGTVLRGGDFTASVFRGGGNRLVIPDDRLGEGMCRPAPFRNSGSLLVLLLRHSLSAAKNR